LEKQQRDNLSSLGVSYFPFGRADYYFNDDLVLRCGHDEITIYWSEDHKASSFSNCDGSIIGVRALLKR